MESQALRSKDTGKFCVITKVDLCGCDKLPCLEVEMDKAWTRIDSELRT